MGFDRQEQFQRNPKLEELLAELNGLLGPLEDQILVDYRMPKYPVVLVTGLPRCGSTLILQWLANTGKFAYPTNLLSRFFGAPFIGAKIQQLLTDPEYSFRDELLDFNSGVAFTSELGKTKGPLSPNEFWYFWRRFIPNTEPIYLDNRALEEVDSRKFAAELAAIEAVFDKPVAMKGLILALNIPFLSSIFEKVLFLFIKRHPFYNIQSLLEARLKYFGDHHSWYSIKPKEYDMLKDLDPIEQVSGQVYFTNQAMEEGLAQIDTSRKLVVSYKDFCTAPEATFHRILVKFAEQGYRVQWDYLGPQKFQPTNQVRLPNTDCIKIINAYQHFSGVKLTL